MEQTLQNKRIEQLEKQNRELSEALEKTLLHPRPDTQPQGANVALPPQDFNRLVQGLGTRQGNQDDSGSALLKMLLQSQQPQSESDEFMKTLMSSAMQNVLNGLQLQNKVMESIIFEKLGISPVRTRTTSTTRLEYKPSE